MPPATACGVEQRLWDIGDIVKLIEEWEGEMIPDLPRKIPLIGLGLIVLSLVWLLSGMLLEANADLIVFPFGALFFIGFGLIGGWVTLKFFRPFS